VLVTNQFGDNKVAVYALGHLKAGKTVADLAPSRLQFEAGVGQPKTTGVGAALPATLPANAQDIVGADAPPATVPSPTRPPARAVEASQRK
jgi:hypothetical protein